MSPSSTDWTEESEAEAPAAKLLSAIGYAFVHADLLEAERESLRVPVLSVRLAAALGRLNPWLSSENLQRAMRLITSVASTSLIEVSEKLHTSITHGIALEQDVGDGKKGQTIRFVDFDTPKNNEFIFTRQFKVGGAKKNIIPDIVVFVNGLPLVVIECKSPTLGGKWLEEAVTQLLRYQEVGSEFRDMGAPKLFETVQLVIAACGQSASYATIGTAQRFWAEWKVSFPVTEAELAKQLGRKASRQDICLAGLLHPANLLDIMRNFTVFEAERGKTIRKVCRYKQFAAVNKALDRVRAATTMTERGGVVWHTQGSGKSLTMLWLALKLRRASGLDNPTILVVTDRIDLDTQISKTFINCGFPNPEKAKSVRGLRELLAGANGQTITTTVQKFQDLAKGGDDRGQRRERQEHPVLSTAANIFVMVDECHRTQYASLAANMRKALPNACFLGFTGTPIDKDDRSTLQTFGPYIDTYTIEQAVEDDATVPIFYESRLAELRIVGQTLDKVFDHVFADRTDKERDAIKKKYATEQAVAEAPKRIEAVCLDLIEHYRKFIQPNGFKAQVVGVSRDAAITFKETLDRLQGPESALVISVGHNDDKRFEPYRMSKEQTDRIIERFLDPTDPLCFLVVCDKLLTGFDAPVEQVMYLDSPLREHTLLQAIARVNRKADAKTYGLVVDYWGVSESLQDALAIFSPSDVQGALKPKSDELPRLQVRHREAMRVFDGVKDKNNLDDCVAMLEPEDVRANFDEKFRGFAESIDMLLPDPRALPYVDDAKWLGKIRAAAKARFRDETLDISGCGAKVRKLIEESVIAEGIQILVKEVSIFSKDFEEKVDRLRTPEAKASEMEHAIRHEIHVKLEENPAFFGSLRERLEKIIEDRKQKRIDAAKQLELLKELTVEIRGEAKAAADAGLSDMAFAIYGVLETALPAAGEREIEYDAAHTALASLIEKDIDQHTRLLDWTQKPSLLKEMRANVKTQLRAARFPKETLETVADRIIDLAKVRKGR
ncbi:MAG: type I restriction endonuclease subunit R [Archangium sp.]|nr:type I restriction endonuclease subunit R [Archangium sp.]